jgi:Protein of unknown function (DUF2934)
LDDQKHTASTGVEIISVPLPLNRPWTTEPVIQDAVPSEAIFGECREIRPHSRERMGNVLSSIRCDLELLGRDQVYMRRPPEIEIIRKAYELWEQSGKPEGRDQEFYLQALQELQTLPDNNASGDNQ